jgi:hypothetical protein
MRPPFYSTTPPIHDNSRLGGLYPLVFFTIVIGASQLYSWVSSDRTRSFFLLKKLVPLSLVSGGTLQSQELEAAAAQVLNPDDYRCYFPDDTSFAVAKEVAPFLDLPNSTEYHAVLVAYYYRIRSYRKHIRVVASSDSNNCTHYVVTEFLPPVPWAGKDNTISAAAGHHILEGRWFWDAPIFLGDYIRFWYLEGGGGGEQQQNQKLMGQQPQPHLAQYTNWIYHATWHYALLWSHTASTTQLLRDTFVSAANVFRTIYRYKYLTNSSSNTAHWNASNRTCWTQEDGYDAMEVSVSGGGCRPTIAAVMYGEATALVHVAMLLLRNDNANNSHRLYRQAIPEFSLWATFSQEVITQQHWNPTISSFAVIPTPQPKMTLASPASQCNLQSVRTPNQPVNVRELLAYMPWYYSSLLKNHDNATMFATQFQWLLDASGDDGFTALWGLRTVQRSTRCYNYSWQHGDCWNGPSWPYETSRVLTAIANLIQEHPPDSAIVKASRMTPVGWEQLFLQYARQHTQTTAMNDTAHPPQSGHVFENLHPDLGYWNNRNQMYWANNTNKDMGNDYNHSTFLDLVFSAWLGIRFLDDHDNQQPWLTLKPLIQAPYFAADRIPYRGRILSIVYDSTGDHHYPKVLRENGLVILVDGRVVAQRADMGPLVVLEEPLQQGRSQGHTVNLVAKT